MNCVALLISHDVIDPTTCGKIQSKKHQSTNGSLASDRSKQVITLLNHFGYGIAITQVQELETCSAEQHLKEQEGKSAYLLYVLG